MSALSGKSPADIPADWVQGQVNEAFSSDLKLGQSDAKFLAEVLTFAGFDSQQLN
jgi:hypothetical protein